MKTRRGMCWAAPCVAVALVLILGSCGGRKSEQFRQQGDTMLDLGKLDEASQFYAQALDADAANAGAVVGQGKVLAAEKKYDEALAKFRDALTMESTNAAAYDAAVATLLAAGRREEALAMAEQFKAVDEEKATALIASINSAESLGPEIAPVPESKAPATAPAAPSVSASAASDSPVADWEILWRQGALSDMLDKRPQWANVNDPRLNDALVMSAVFAHNMELARELSSKLP